MAGPVILAFDLGQTQFKAAAFDLDGTLVGHEVARNNEYADGSFAWQEPGEWWDTAGALSNALLRRPELAGRRVGAIGVSGRGAAGVPIDRGGTPILPSWSDNRHRQHARQVVERCAGDPRVARSTEPLARYLWMREQTPELAARVAHLLFAKDWLVYRMTGRAVTDPASGPDADDFDRGLIATFGVNSDLFPEVRFPWDVAGPLGDDGSAHLGMPPGTPVSVGGHDGICANLGAGAGSPGSYAITLGTHAVVRAVVATPLPGAPRFYGMPPDRHVIGGNAIWAGRSPDWLLDAWKVTPDEGDRAKVFALMDAEAAKVAPGAAGVRFFPYFGGQRTPDRRPGASAALVGLRLDHGRAELYRAALEGSAFAIRAIWDHLHQWCGDPQLVRFTGSGASAATWRQIIVDAINWPVDVTDGLAEARGAAIYAAVAVEAYADVDCAAKAMVRPTVRLEPDPGRAAEYATIFADWQRLSRAMRPLDNDDS